MKTIEVQTEPTDIEALVAMARKESGIVLTKSGEPIAKVIPVEAKTRKRVSPLHPGAWSVSDDFDEPLHDDFWLGRQ